MANSSNNNNNDAKSLNATETLPATTTAFGAIRMPVTKTFASVAMSAPTNGGLLAKSLEKSCCSSSNTNSTTTSTTSSSSSTMKISQHLQQHQQQNQCAAASLKANGSNATTAAATATNQRGEYDEKRQQLGAPITVATTNTSIQLCFSIKNTQIMCVFILVNK